MLESIPDEATFWSNSNFLCPFECNIKLSKSINVAINHLKIHNISIINPVQIVPFFEQYVNSIYDKKFSSAEDLDLRRQLSQETLQQVIGIQQQERNLQVEQSCLFCREKTPNVQTLFSHMHQVHGLKIGQLDNLVHVQEFLSLISQQLKALKCLLCENIFDANLTLRKHMRKKKHFRINPRNPIYDRFYLRNYMFDLDLDVDDNDGYDFEDWDDVEPVETMCLFDECLFETPEECCEHMLSEHGFDLVGENHLIHDDEFDPTNIDFNPTIQSPINSKSSIDFYKRIRLINYIREKQSNCVCFTCGEEFDNCQELIEHFKNNDHLKIPKNSVCWTDPKYFFPFHESDPLLTLDFE